MATEESMKDLRDLSSEEFARAIPLYHGPTVKVRVGGATYDVSKALLCTRVPYFAARLNGNSKEGEEQSIVLPEVEEVVSVRSFDLLLQWLYCGRFAFVIAATEDQISAAIEFARLSHMLGVGNVESRLADAIKAKILRNPPPPSYTPPPPPLSYTTKMRDPNTNIYHITSQHVYSATRLPERHPVRILFAKAAIEGYLRSENFKFDKEIRDVPEFAADLLIELMPTLKGFKLEATNSFGVGYGPYPYPPIPDLSRPRDVMFTDPFSGEKLRLY